MSRQCKILNVAEKNDAAKELAKVMSRGRVRRVRNSLASSCTCTCDHVLSTLRGRVAQNSTKYMNLILIFLVRYCIH